jgi:hypothetical protein
MSAKKTKEEEQKNEEKPETFSALKKDIKDKLEELKDVKRPEINNPIIPNDELMMINLFLLNAYDNIEEYAANLRALDRTRLNSIASRKMGFVEDAYDFALKNGEFLPKFLTIERFTRDYDYFKAVRALLELANQIRELLWNVTIEAADVVYTDALEFYQTVKEAARRRVDGADTIYRKLEPFFKKNRRQTGELTKKQEERDIKGLLSGKREGEVLVRNVKPKFIAGGLEVIERKIENSAVLHETKNVEFDE